MTKQTLAKVEVIYDVPGKQCYTKYRETFMWCVWIFFPPKNQEEECIGLPVEITNCIFFFCF